jgi:hypothetical protein
MRRSFVIFLPALLAACGPQGTDYLPHNGARDVDMAMPPHGPINDLGTDDTTCGGQQFTVERTKPNVFLVVDRSGSMGNPIASGSSTKKWDDLKFALTNLVTGFDSQIRLGMSLYNRDGNCAAGLIDTPVSDANGATVMNQINATSTGGNTPTAATLDYVRQYGNLNDPTRPNVVVLATDGEPNCGDTDVTGKITALYNQTPSVRTFVIGLGTETYSNPTLLSAWADAGHTARSGATHYFQSNSQSELSDAFQTIVGGIVSCTFSLSSAPPDPSQLYVWLGGVQLPMDPGNGYTYLDGPPSVTLNGPVCDQLKADPSKKIQVVYGCPLPPPIL